MTEEQDKESKNKQDKGNNSSLNESGLGVITTEDKQDKGSKDEDKQDKESVGAPAPDSGKAQHKSLMSSISDGGKIVGGIAILVCCITLYEIFNPASERKSQKEQDTQDTFVGYDASSQSSRYTSDISEKLPELSVADTQIAEKRYDKEMVELFGEYLNSNQFVKIKGKTLDNITNKCVEGFATFLLTVNKDVKSKKYSDEALEWTIGNVYNYNPCNKYIGTMLNKGGLTIDNNDNILKDGKNVEVNISPKK